MHVSTVITYDKRVKINRVLLPVLLVVSCTGTGVFFVSPFAPEDFGLVRQSVLRQPTLSPHCHHQGASNWCLLVGFLSLSSAASVFECIPSISGQSRIYQVAQLRTDGFTAEMPPAHGISVRLSFPTPTTGTVDMCATVCVCIY